MILGIVIALLFLWIVAQRAYFWYIGASMRNEIENAKPKHTPFMPLHIEKIDAVSETSIGKQFKAQKERMEFQAMIPHEADCDIFSCRKPVCFIRRPDTIVKEHAPGTVTVVHTLPADEFETIRFNDPLKQRKRKKVD